MGYPAQAADIPAPAGPSGARTGGPRGPTPWGQGRHAARQAGPDRVSQAGGGGHRPGGLSPRPPQNVFAGLNATLATPPEPQREAEAILAEHIQIAGVRQFLLKSSPKGSLDGGWRFNVPAPPRRNYANIAGWPDDERRFEGPDALHQGATPTMLPEYTGTAMAQFPAAKAASSLAPVTGCTRKKAGFVQQTGCGFPVDRRLTVSNPL